MLGAVLAPDGVLDLRRLRSFVPAEWAPHTSVGLDGVIRISRPTGAGLGDVPGPARDQLRAAAPALQRQPLSGEQALEALEAGHALAARLEAARMHATRELAARTAEKALALKGVTSPEELSATAFTRWRVRSKSVTAAEVRALTGMGVGTAREVVAVATAPTACTAPVQQGLDAGIARWDLVLAWWRRCTDLPHEASAQVARSLFGTDVPTDEVAVERLTPEGELSAAPWAKKQFYDALEREARRHEADDPAAQERKRAARHRSRDAFAIVDDDGTAQLVVKGDVASVTACLERLHTIATKARAEGDPRTVSALRSDAARALLLHGTLPMPDLGDDPNLLTPDDIARLVDVISGTPAHELQVVVPWDVLSGHAAVVNAYAGAPASSAPAADPGPPGSASPGPPGSADPCPPQTAAPGSPSPPGPGVQAGVARVLGRFSRFLSGAEVRRMAGRPGTTLYRLLTDPADGRCLERSLARYAPDAAMRAQLRAADVMSRAPGSTVPADRCDLDHVQEYLLGGPTSETNLQSADRPWHALKTEKFWDAVMDATRNVTWESFWGRLYRTRPHDYRQYLSRPRPEDPPGDPTAELTAHEQRHLASLLVYAALAHRQPGDRLEAEDDDPDSDEAILGLREAMWIRHTAADGRRRTGPAPGTPTPEDLIARDPRTVLDHPAWTTLGDDATDDDDGDAGAAPHQPPPPPPF